MTFKDSTIASIEESIKELTIAIEQVENSPIKKELLLKLKKLKKAKDGLKPSSRVHSLYILTIPLTIIFLFLGVYYFSQCKSKN